MLALTKSAGEISGHHTCSLNVRRVLLSVFEIQAMLVFTLLAAKE